MFEPAAKDFPFHGYCIGNARIRAAQMSETLVLDPIMPLADSAALERILREYAPMCQRLAGIHEANPERARDLAQEILVAVWRAWPAFRAQCSERTYVARIAQYRIATHISRAVRDPKLAPLTEELPATDSSPEEVAIRGDERARLTEFVRRLPVSLREVAVLVLEGFSMTEIADTLGITQNAVSLRAVRAREMLRDMFGERP